MKTLYLLRHAKSSWNSAAPNDFMRPLSRRGKSDVALLATEFERRQWHVENIVFSPALRCRMTIEGLATVISKAKHIREEDDLYHASMPTLLRVIKSIDESVDSLLLVAHNPGLEMLLEYLIGDVEYTENGKLFTTGNVAQIAVMGEWQNLSPSGCELLMHFRPKEIGSSSTP